MSSIDKILITGASSGLGSYLANYFADKGHDLILAGRDENKLNDLTKKIQTNTSVMVGDLRNHFYLEELKDKFVEEGGTVLINNAGMTCPGVSIDELGVEEILDMIDVNLVAPFLLIKHLHKNLSYIININSMVGLEHKKFRTAYSASKWGLRGFSDSFRLETNVKILDVYPTSIKTKPERVNAMEVDFICDKIYESYSNKLNEKLILDGRPK